MRSKTYRWQLVTLALLALSMAYCSKESSKPPAQSRFANQSAAQPQAKAKVTFVVELDPKADVTLGGSDGVRMVEAFMTADKAYAIYEAETADLLTNYLKRAGISAKRVIEVRDINLPTRGGGQAPQKQPREGHKTFVIERKIPGIGSFPDEKKQAIARKSNAAVANIGTSIEWDHSYLTAEGTYCVYRATDEKTIRKHASIVGAPVNKVSEVQTVVFPK